MTKSCIFVRLCGVFLRAWYHFVKNENEPTRTTFKSHKNTVTSRFQQHNRTFLHLFWSVFLRDNVSCISVTFHVHYFLTGYNIVRFYVQVFWCILLLVHLHSNLALIFLMSENVFCKPQWVCVHQRIALCKRYLLLLLLLLLSSLSLSLSWKISAISLFLRCQSSWLTATRPLIVLFCLRLLPLSARRNVNSRKNVTFPRQKPIRERHAQHGWLKLPCQALSSGNRAKCEPQLWG